MNIEVCPICGEAVRVKYDIGSRVLICGTCNLLFAPDLEFKDNDQDAFDYDNHIAALRALRNDNFDKIIRKLNEYLPGDARGLEVGCGYGWFMERVAGQGCHCLGIEPEKKMCDICRSKGLNVINGYFPQDLPTERFDFVVFNDVFEHLPDIKVAMDAVRTVLKDDGVLLLNVPVSSGPFYRIAELVYHCGNNQLLRRMWQCDFYSPHYYYFNKRSISRLLNKYGFKLVGSQQLKTITAGSMKARLDMGGISGLLYGVGMLATPLLTLLNGDVACFFAQKISL